MNKLTLIMHDKYDHRIDLSNSKQLYDLELTMYSEYDYPFDLWNNKELTFHSKIYEKCDYPFGFSNNTRLSYLHLLVNIIIQSIYQKTIL